MSEVIANIYLLKIFRKLLVIKGSYAEIWPKVFPRSKVAVGCIHIQHPKTSRLASKAPEVNFSLQGSTNFKPSSTCTHDTKVPPLFIPARQKKKWLLQLRLFDPL